MQFDEKRPQQRVITNFNMQDFERAFVKASFPSESIETVTLAREQEDAREGPPALSIDCGGLQRSTEVL